MQFLGPDAHQFKGSLLQRGYPAFRFKQIAQWVYQKGVLNPQEMTNLPQSLIEEIKVMSLTEDQKLVSRDQTIKYRFKLQGEDFVEAVAIPMSADDWTLCVSSQSGCAMGCVFCATGTIKKFRNLSGTEIVEQFLWHRHAAGSTPSRIVFMGMGEPLTNRSNLEEAIHIFVDEIGLSSRRLTVSTVGLPDGIQWLSQISKKVNLAVSLHSAIEATRAQLVTQLPTSVADIVAAARDYRDVTGRDVTYEIVLLKGVNDDPAHAEALARIAGRGFIVNLIPFNPGGAGKWSAPSPAAVHKFRSVLEERGVTVTQRKPKGQDIQAACGELALS